MSGIATMQSLPDSSVAMHYISVEVAYPCRGEGLAEHCAASSASQCRCFRLQQLSLRPCITMKGA